MTRRTSTRAGSRWTSRPRPHDLAGVVRANHDLRVGQGRTVMVKTISGPLVVGAAGQAFGVQLNHAQALGAAAGHFTQKKALESRVCPIHVPFYRAEHWLN